jgi:hypothetical protein
MTVIDLSDKGQSNFLSSIYEIQAAVLNAVGPTTPLFVLPASGASENAFWRVAICALVRTAGVFPSAARALVVLDVTRRSSRKGADVTPAFAGG